MTDIEIFYLLAGKALLYDLEYDDIELAKSILTMYNWEFIHLITKYPKRERIEPRFNFSYSERIRNSLLSSAGMFKVKVK